MSSATLKPVIPRGRAGLNATYGNPMGKDGRLDSAWYATNIVRMPVPFPAPYNKMRLAWDTDTAVYSLAIHRLVAPELTEILMDIWNHARMMVKRQDGFDRTTEYYDRETMSLLRFYGLDLYGGGFNYRLKRGGRTLSTHSWGCAVDLDPERNGMGDTTPAMPLWAVEKFTERGWVWGGYWQGRSCDGMHFQRATGV